MKQVKLIAVSVMAILSLGAIVATTAAFAENPLNLTQPKCWITTYIHGH